MNNVSITHDPDSAATTARVMLSAMVIAAAAAFACVVVGTRGIDVGTDTRTYAEFFLSLGHGPVTTRLEPGFVLMTRLLRYLGLGVAGYQAALFAFLLFTVVLSSRKYFDYLGERRRYLGYLMACLALLYLSPMFVNASINTVRQGMASLLVFTALLCFHQRQWWQFLLYGALASSLHYSSLLYLVFAPALLLRQRVLRILAGVAFVVYCSGLSELLVRATVPVVYNVVMDYVPNATFRAGTRLDFAVFSIFWYALPYLGAKLVPARMAEKIQESTAVYLVLLLPFFAIGWGNFSNRYLLPAWLSASLVVAALVFHSRVAFLRSPLFLGALLIAACGVYAYYVNHMVII